MRILAGFKPVATRKWERGLYPRRIVHTVLLMPDQPDDPPRKFYGFKAREFERANETGAPPPPPAAEVDPGITAGPNRRIDVRELIRIGAGQGSQLGSNAVANRANEVHGILRDNLARDRAAGHYGLGTLDDSKRRRRIRNYWLALAGVNIPLGLIALFFGPGAAIPFVCAIAGIAMFTAAMTWQTFFLRTRY